MGVGDTVNSEPALRSEGILLVRVRAPPTAHRLYGEPESLRSPCSSPQLGDLRLSGSPSGPDAAGGARIRDQRVGTDFNASQSKSKAEKPVENGEYTGNLRLLSDSDQPESPLPRKDHVVVLPHVYRRRWLMLSLFCLLSFSNAFQWIHLNIIANVIGNFYNESLPQSTYQRNTAIDWLSMVYMLAYIPLIFPATWILNRRGLRLCCILGSTLNAVGAWLKCASISPGRFGLLMFAQTICAVAQLFVLGIPARLAAVWFGPNEVSTATSIGVFGNQVGVAVGFLLPPILVANSGDVDTMSRDFQIMFYGTAGLTTFLFILIVLMFRDKPPHPPSRAQLLAVEAATHENYFQSLLRLVKNRGFVVLTIAYGINTGSFYGISTLLNAIILEYFDNEEENAGRIGLTIVLCGIVGAVLAGIWLDKTKKFKETTIGIYLLSLAGALAFTFMLDLGKIWIVFLTAGSLGFFMTGYLPVGFEFAAEITFPESEGTSSGLLNASAQFFGIIFTLGMRALMEEVSVFSGNITMCACLLLGGIMTALIKADYRRQEAGKHVAEKFLETEVEVQRSDPNHEERQSNGTQPLT
ncbi:feline leukemia virus subgroup c receptor-related protein 2 [Plakobranchus ocellatus]|uniref:Choline/ethanolamine transporter FLVCR1 n=1 Tax=Plakobranchus ocellatus TaxID=259542 RepID=A0AAV4DRI0_9GAST|nr:feline leukemia virus subgroup c receptor-related protein 2 [Plakobranchus ocellatus]